MPAIKEIDELNAMLQRAQDRLKNEPCLQKVWIKVCDDFCVGMIKRSLGWKICVGSSSTNDEPIHWTPVSEAPVVLRIKAAKHVMKLLPVIQRSNAVTISMARDAAVYLKSLLSQEQADGQVQSRDGFTAPTR